MTGAAARGGTSGATLGTDCAIDGSEGIGSGMDPRLGKSGGKHYYSAFRLLSGIATRKTPIIFVRTNPFHTSLPSPVGRAELFVSFNHC